MLARAARLLWAVAYNYQVSGVAWLNDDLSIALTSSYGTGGHLRWKAIGYHSTDPALNDNDYPIPDADWGGPTVLQVVRRAQRLDETHYDVLVNVTTGGGHRHLWALHFQADDTGTSYLGSTDVGALGAVVTDNYQVEPAGDNNYVVFQTYRINAIEFGLITWDGAWHIEATDSLALTPFVLPDKPVLSGQQVEIVDMVWMSGQRFVGFGDYDYYTDPSLTVSTDGGYVFGRIWCTIDRVGVGNWSVVAVNMEDGREDTWGFNG